MSTPAGTCPQTQVFVEFLNGDLSDSAIETLAAHLSQCSACGDTLRAMNVDDTLLTMARSVEPLADDEAQLVDRLVAKLQRLQPTCDSGKATLEEDAKARAEEVRLLLAPAAESDELGRLAHYRILRLLGAGGMGVVYQAEDLQLKRLVALKVLRPSLGTAARERFLHEARAAAAIDHDHVITIYQVDREGPLAFIAMQWLEGETLECRLQRQGSLPPEEVEEIGKQIAQGLAAAHGKGLIHRDIKPANIWLETNRSRARILDFGLARTVDDNPQLTETGMIAGTPAYMSPEQSQGRDVSERSDLFSLGCVLYRAITGRFPFQAPNALAVLRAIQQEEPESPRDVNIIVSQRMSDLVMWLLAKLPNDRPPSAEAWVDAIENPDFRIPPTSNAGTTNQQAMPQAQATGRGSKYRWWGWAAALIVLGSLGFFAAPTIIRVATNQGQLVIKTNDPNVQVEIVDQGNTIRLVDLRTKQSVSIDVPAGEYRINVSESSGDVKLSQNKVTLYRGGREIVEVVKVGPSKDAAKLTAKTDLDRLQGRWQLMSSDGNEEILHGLKDNETWLLEINGDRVALLSDSEVDFQGTLEIDESRKTVDFNVVDSPGTEAVTRRGIYSIGLGYGLRIAIGMESRPTSFKPGEGVEIARFQRVDSLPLAIDFATNETGKRSADQPGRGAAETYDGVTLADWLATAERERSPSELRTATMALAALGNAEHAEACARAVLKMMRVHGTRNPTEGAFTDDPRLILNIEARRALFQMSPAGVVEALAAEIEEGNQRSHAFMTFLLPTPSWYILNTDFADYEHLEAELKGAHKPLVAQLLDRSRSGTVEERRWAVEFLALLCNAVDIDYSSVEGLVPCFQSELTSSDANLVLTVAECLVPAAPDSPGLTEALLGVMDEPKTNLLAIQLIGELGGRGAPAVPEFRKRIRQFSRRMSSGIAEQDEMRLVHEILVALAKMGAAARDALPELQPLARWQTNSAFQQRLILEPAQAAIEAIESAPVEGRQVIETVPPFAAQSSLHELEKLIQVNGELLDAVVIRHEAGQASLTDRIAAEINLVEAQLRLAESKKNADELVTAVRQLLLLYEQNVDAVRTQHEAGTVTEIVLREAEKALIEARLRYGVKSNETDDSAAIPPQPTDRDDP